ncbi:hypothetical protein ABPG72_003891 [Tetrahymena utriculariae]
MSSEFLNQFQQFCSKLEQKQDNSQQIIQQIQVYFLEYNTNCQNNQTKEEKSIIENVLIQKNIDQNQENLQSNTIQDQSQTTSISNNIQDQNQATISQTNLISNIFQDQNQATRSNIFSDQSQTTLISNIVQDQNQAIISNNIQDQNQTITIRNIFQDQNQKNQTSNNNIQDQNQVVLTSNNEKTQHQLQLDNENNQKYQDQMQNTIQDLNEKLEKNIVKIVIKNQKYKAKNENIQDQQFIETESILYSNPAVFLQVQLADKYIQTDVSFQSNDDFIKFNYNFGLATNDNIKIDIIQQDFKKQIMKMDTAFQLAQQTDNIINEDPNILGYIQINGIACPFIQPAPFLIEKQKLSTKNQIIFEQLVYENKDVQLNQQFSKQNSIRNQQ